MACFAFQISTEDVENVLRSYSLRVTDTKGQSFERMAEELIDELDHERIEREALAASTELDEQTTAAYEAIKNNLVELGVLEF
ncbi:hypothetical protein R2571_006404 [Pseudomonas aeruginosa]|nr:hypothetical protein [Pseudomonas aeruginosa]